MYKALAVLRTIYLVFIVGYTVRLMPFFSSVPNTLDEQYARCAATLNGFLRAAWYAIAWVAFEVLIGWLLVVFAQNRNQARLPAAPSGPSGSPTPPVPPASPGSGPAQS